MYEEKTGLWVEIIENPSELQAHILALLSKEMPEVELFFGGSTSLTLVWVKGPQHRVRWFVYLFERESSELENQIDSSVKASL